MKGLGAGLVILLATAFGGYGETQLPESDDYESFEVEPAVLLPNRDADSLKPALPGSPDELEKRVERAKRVAADAEQLCKRGVLSRMEVEARALRLVRLQSDLEKARLDRAEADLAIQRTKSDMGEVTKEVLAAAEQAVQTAREAAQAAATARARAEITAAEANLRREQKLAALGSARPADIARAKQRLADLKAAKQ